MRLALQTRDECGRDPADLAVLPGLCCQAAGGEFSQADPPAAAWLLFYTAAHLMDCVEDGDAPDPWWREQGPAAALNAATGLFFSAGIALDELENRSVDAATARAVRRAMLRPFLHMSSGQYSDTLHPADSLEAFWRTVAAKSGAFFALGCCAGARLATADADRLAGFEQFGMALGCMVQVLDDLADFRDLHRSDDLYRLDHPVDPAGLRRSLPAVYLREVCPADVYRRFEQLTELASEDPAALQELMKIIEDNGGVLYLLSETDRQAGQALAGLDAARASGPARSQLEAWIAALQP